MIDLGTFLGSKIATSIEVNGLLVPTDSVAKAIVSYVDPALFHTSEMEPYNYFISGSSFRFKYRERYFLVCTEHQLQSVSADFDQLAIIDGKTPQKLVTSHKIVWDKSGSLDLSLFEFTEAVRSGALRTSIWYQAKQHELFERVQSASKCYCVGYPGQINNLNFEEQKFDCKPYGVYGTMSESAIRGRLSFSPSPQTDLPPSGMSGSPVFGITLDNLTPITFWAGILTNASKKVFNFIPAHKVGDMLASIGSD